MNNNENINKQILDKVDGLGALFCTRLAAIEAQLLVNYNLLRTILINQGTDVAELDKNHQETFNSYRDKMIEEYKKTLDHYGEKRDQSDAENNAQSVSKGEINQFVKRFAEYIEHNPGKYFIPFYESYSNEPGIHPKLKTALATLTKGTYNGKILSDLVSHFPEVFPARLVEAFNAGEINKEGYLHHLKIYLKYNSDEFLNDVK